MASRSPRCTMSHTIASAALLAAFAAAAVGCGGSNHASDPPATPNVAAAWQRVVRCARTHGMPGLRDPRITPDGKAVFPQGLNLPETTRHACQSMVARLVPGGGDTNPTASDLAALLRFSRCMRGRGIPDWPDPLPDGTFQPATRIANSLKTVFRSQFMACERFNPDPRGRLSFSHP